ENSSEVCAFILSSDIESILQILKLISWIPRASDADIDPKFRRLVGRLNPCGALKDEPNIDIRPFGLLPFFKKQASTYYVGLRFFQVFLSETADMYIRAINEAPKWVGGCVILFMQLGWRNVWTPNRTSRTAAQKYCAIAHLLHGIDAQGCGLMMNVG
ncbi:hypothetical protein TWF569_002963, partial [Orbilia oligospora]